ncbi:MAG: HDOD domain-containing protein [Planctomycetota bacterium]
MSTFRAKQIISKCPNLPTLPAIVQQVSQMLLDPNVGTKEIGRLVAQDPPLAARVLKIANSSYYGLRERCVSTEQASAVLGVKVLRNVVTAAAVMKQFAHLEERGIDLDAMWKHSILVAQAANLLARSSRGGVGLSAEEFYTCGLLHDIGKLVLLENLGEEYVTLLVRSNRESVPLQTCERDALLFDHTDVGSMIAVQWGLPAAVASAIQFHHGPREAIELDPVVSLVAHANLLVKRVQAGNLSAAASVVDPATSRFLAVTPEDVTRVVTLVAEQSTAAVA